MGLIKDEVFVCLDCEFTGLDQEKDRILELGVATFQGGAIHNSFETLIDPECLISEGALAIHKITQSMLEGKPKIKEVLPEVLSLVDEHIIIGHSISFDIQMIEREAKQSLVTSKLTQSKTIDTLRLARLYGDSPNNSLENLARHFNIKVEGEAHRAMTDVKMNIEVFKQLTRRFKTVEEIFSTLSRPIKMKYMPLGKYKGRLFSEIPLDYLQYSLKLDFDQDLRFSIQSEIKKRKSGSQFSQATNPFMGL